METHTSFQPFLDQPIDSVILPNNQSVTVARVELGLTLYVADTLAWAHEGVAKLLQSFLAVVPPDHLSWYSTSHMGSWRKVDQGAMSELAASVSLTWSESRPRHLLEFVLTDDVACPSCGFYYREIDTERAARAGVVEVTLPQEFDPGYLLPIARAAVAAGNLWSGIGGYAVRLSRAFRADAFDIAWAWARRYRGIDIQDPERLAWRAREGLPGVNWLTILGRSLAEERGFDVAGALNHRWTDPRIAVEESSGNLLIRAGEHPVVGDSHRFEDPTAYREVASVAQNLLLEEPPEFLGYFSERDSTAKWFRRFVDGGWPD